jgi:uncharacterized membrane protein YhaH (DUF805 family)
VFSFIQILYLYMIFVTQDKFGVRSLRDSKYEMMAALYLQVSIVSQALIFVTRSRSWSFVERPGLLLVSAFVVAQLVRIHPIRQSLLKTTLPTMLSLSWPSLVCAASSFLSRAMHFIYLLLMIILGSAF